MHNVMQTARDTIEREGLLLPGNTVYVALSGGADSVTLLHVLLNLKDELSLKAVRALHVNHGLRGEYADRDEAFVRKLCHAWDVPLAVEHANVRALAEQTHKTIEEAARDVRYAFFMRKTDGEEGAKIATAHTANDRAETVLFRMIRGCGLRGLAGIPYQRESIVRPLLDCSEAEVRAYIAEHQLTFVHDETNDDMQYSRNFVRHRILPQLEQLNPAAVTAILRLSDLAATDDRYLQKEAENLLKTAETSKGIYRADTIAQAADPIATRALMQAAVTVSGVCPEQHHVDAMLRIVRERGAVSLPGDWVAACDGKSLCFEHFDRTNSLPKEDEPVKLEIDREMLFQGERYIATVLTMKDFLKKQKIHKNLLDFCIAYDMINDSTHLRSRRDGDAFRPYKRHCTKTLKQFFQEHNVPAKQRPKIPLICDENGILAVLGYGVDERAAVREGTQQILYIQNLSKGSE